MNFKEKKGFLNLAKKTMAVITGSISALIGTEAQATEVVAAPEAESATIEVAFKKELKPQFTLRLSSNPEKSMLFMHRSHSSHSSHRSHSSHSSHYSSSANYSPPAPTRTVTRTPSTYTTSTPSSTSSTSSSISSTPKRSSTIKSTIKTNSSYVGTNTISSATLDVIGYYYRVLYKGCEGMDVEYLQNLLVAAGYITPTTGYFGDKTDAAVKKFQQENELKPDGKVGEKTHQILKDKVDEL